MSKSTSPAKPPCRACGEPVEEIAAFHMHCIDRLLASMRRPRDQRGASLVEYVMLMAFVAVVAIIGVRAGGPTAAALFDTERLGLTAPAPTEVLGVTVERVELPPIACQAGSGIPAPTCPE